MYSLSSCETLLISFSSNGSQFFITLRPCPHLNGKHVVFGRIVRGFEDVIQKVAAVPTDDKDRPLRPVVIVNCGELERKKVPAIKRAPSRSVSPVESEDYGLQNKKRPRRRSSVSSGTDIGDGSDHKPKSKSKRHSKSKYKSKRHKGDPSPLAFPHQETEEEYDLRLEREENERLEAARKLELARLRERLAKEEEERERQSKESGAINYKGYNKSFILLALGSLFI